MRHPYSSVFAHLCAASSLKVLPMPNPTCLPNEALPETAAVQDFQKQIAAAATDHGWQAEQDTLGLAEYVGQALAESRDAACRLAAPDPAGAPWGCYDCGFSGHHFRTFVKRESEFEVECPSCGSHHTDEAKAVLRELVATVEELREQRQQAPVCATPGPQRSGA